MTVPVEPTRWVTRRFADTDVALAVHEAGEPSSPTVLMVHGWPDTHTLWTGVAELLADTFHVVSYDVRGAGRSTRPGEDAAYAMKELVADLRAVADAVSPDRPVHLLAHDWGSVQAWDAVCAPDAADRFASFTSISGPNIDHTARWVRASLRSPGRLPQVVAQAVSSAYVLYFVSPLAPPVMRRITKERWERTLQRLEGIEPQPWHHADTLPDDMADGLALYRANVARRIGGPRDRTTTVPVLQIVPTRDVAIRKETLRGSEPYAERLERVEVPHGHWVVLSHPEVVADLTRDLIRTASGAEPPRAP